MARIGIVQLQLATPLDPITGLVFPSNNVSGSDVRLIWDSANLLPRDAHSAIWRANFRSDSSFHAIAAHCSNDGTWHGFSQTEFTRMYDFLTCSYPYRGADGVFASGQAAASHQEGSERYWEIAGLEAFGRDFLATAGSSTLYQVAYGREYIQARQSKIIVGGADDGKIECLFYFDLPDQTKVIRQVIANDYVAATSPAFCMGAHPWTSSNWAGTGSGYTNSECPGADYLRGIQLYSDALGSDLFTEATNHRLNAAQTSAGRAALFYINQNPTPTDVSDKKTGGTAHNPRWPNANRPTLYTA